MSLLTGRYPYRNRCWTNTDSLASDIPTFAHAQGAVGYAPILIGRMHALGSDQLHGYVRREIGDHMTDWYGGSEYSMGILNGAQRPNREALQLSGAGQSSYEVLDREVTGAAIEEIRLIAETGEMEMIHRFRSALATSSPINPTLAIRSWWIITSKEYRRLDCPARKMVNPNFFLGGAMPLG
jgi:arylsulfatase A-like enzyme